MDSQAGVGLVLDRFVPDNRGLELLRELLPVVVKVEATLCRQACADLSARVMLKTLCTHAHALGVRVGASGVERDAEREALRQIGFDLLQGRLIGAPGPL